MSKKVTQQKMKKRIKGAVMQSLEAGAKSAGASGDDAKEDGKKKLAQMIATAADDQQWNAFMPTDAVSPGLQRAAVIVNQVGYQSHLVNIWKCSDQLLSRARRRGASGGGRRRGAGRAHPAGHTPPTAWRGGAR
jgi:hypothetical protein